MAAVACSAAVAALKMPKDLDGWGRRIKSGVVVHALKDPASAKFRGVFVGAWTDEYDGKTIKPVLCGEVNARTSYGGYSGFQRFYADEYSVKFDADRDEWDMFCLMPVRRMK